MHDSTQIRVPYDGVVQALEAVLMRLGFTLDRALRCARLFADASRDGVASHGLNRFPRFVRAVKNHVVDPGAAPALKSRCGALERWDG